MKKLLLLSSLLLLLATAGQAQTIPSYLPTSGLVAWYPFNGNCNDESNNGHNLFSNGAILSQDRYGNANSAYYFNGSSGYLSGGSNSAFYLPSNRTLSVWVNATNSISDVGIVGCMQNSGGWAGHGGYMLLQRAPAFNYTYAALEDSAYSGNALNYQVLGSNTGYSTGSWHHLVAVRSNNLTTLYVDGVLQNGSNSKTPYFNNSIFLVGASGAANQIFNGRIDDIGVWNRALTQNEITQLYTGGPCVTYQTITVTDTLIINANLTGINPVTFQNSIKVYPNPASTSINIDFGSNYATLVGYSMRIDNSIGQTVYTTPVNQQLYTSNLNGWSGNGLYLVYLLNPQGAVVDVRKIIIQ